ncbi:MAG: MBL fold metallo-hydrolase [Dehalococcoidia bacterium]|nr:MBL fold metallo-hydrolase [Dehalococcoidia bacterium]MDD5494913.1 MBL fold metallo-hydrolase [Dehalococcoidia bacterium]
MEIKITTLSENTANHGFLGEWGLSMLVEADGKKILVDTGMGTSATHNADILGIDLAEIDCIVLSHGHIDHTGGLGHVLKRRKETEIIGHPDIWISRYARRSPANVQFIGMPFTQEELEASGARFKFSREPVAITNHIITSGEIEMLTDYETIDDNLLIKESGTFQPDRLADDLSLIINAEYGLVVILGCGHRGLVNTIGQAQKLTGNKRVYAVIGGAHLKYASEERIEKTIADLKKIGVHKLGASHCTGFAASARLAQEFPESFFLNNAGTRLTLPES